MDLDKQLQDTTQAGLGHLARAGLKLGKKALAVIIKQAIVLLAPYLIPLLGMFFLFLVAYTILFLFPKYMMENKVPGSEGKVVSIFNLGEKDKWTQDKDMELAARYKQLSEKTWQDGLEGKDQLINSLNEVFLPEIEAGILSCQQEQAQPHRLPWSVLAGVDRVAGDPIIHRTKILPAPNPEKHYNYLKPTFTWTTFEIVKVIPIPVEGGVIYKRYTGTVKLLDTAKTFEANYKYHWVQNTQYFNNGQLKSIMPKIETIEKNGPYFTPLKKLMAGYKVTDNLELQTILELAELYDDEYSVDASSLGARMEGFELDTTKQYYTGDKGSVCLPVPAKYFIITCPYGMRIHPVTKKRSMHTGIDLGAPSGAPVYSAWQGVVIFTGKYGAYGNAVIVDHGDIKTLYGHLSLITTTRGSTVKAGEPIGLIGSTGLSTGPHLHFGVFKYINGGTVYENPENYFK